MSIEYDFYKTNGALAKKQPYHVRVVEHSTVHSEELAQNIQAGTTLTVADIKGALSALTSEVASQLCMGHRVHLKGLGYFSLSIDGEVTTDKNSQLKLKNPRVRTIRFLPEEHLLQQFNDLSFTCQHHKGSASKTYDEQGLHNIVDSLLSQHSFFTSNDFFKTAHVTRSTGYRLLRQLKDEHYIENIGTPGQHIFTKTHKNNKYE